MIKWFIKNEYGQALYENGTVMATFSIQNDGKGWIIWRGKNGNPCHFNTLYLALINYCGERYAEMAMEDM